MVRLLDSSSIHCPYTKIYSGLFVLLFVGRVFCFPIPQSYFFFTLLCFRPILVPSISFLFDVFSPHWANYMSERKSPEAYIICLVIVYRTLISLSFDFLFFFSFFVLHLFSLYDLTFYQYYLTSYSQLSSSNRKIYERKSLRLRTKLMHWNWLKFAEMAFAGINRQPRQSD